MSNSTTPTRPLAVVTGASGGIGLELAKAAAGAGHDLLLVARRADVLADVSAEIEGMSGVTVTSVAADLATTSGVESVVEALAGHAVEVLINNAGVGGTGKFATERSVADDLAMVALNISALVRLTGEVLPGMVSRGSGGILNVASTAGFLPGPGQAVYYASKAFVRSFSEALTAETRGTGVRVTALSPGPVDTGFAGAAGLESSLLMKYGIAKVSAAGVAAAGWRGLVAGKTEVVPGLLVRASMPGLRILPRALQARMAEQLNH